MADEISFCAATVVVVGVVDVVDVVDVVEDSAEAAVVEVVDEDEVGTVVADVAPPAEGPVSKVTAEIELTEIAAKTRLVFIATS